MTETLPQMRARHEAELRALILSQANARKTQTQASRTLGVSLTCLNNLIQRMGIYWPVKAQGRVAKGIPHA